jgi:hypothetical protein
MLRQVKTLPPADASRKGKLDFIWFFMFCANLTPKPGKMQLQFRANFIIARRISDFVNW